MEKRLAFFDLETTGPDPWRDRIVQVALVTSDGDEYHSLVNPEVDIPKEATAVHGITNEDVAIAPTWLTVGPKVAERLADAVLVGYNSHSFDVVMLQCELNRIGYREYDFMGSEEIDLFRLWKKHEERTLTGALMRFLSMQHEGAHDAVEDIAYLPDLMREMAFTFFGEGWTVERLIEESTDPAEIDRDGKFVRGEDGVVRFNFGKHQGSAVAHNLSYLDWMISADFSPEVKKVARLLKERFSRGRVAAANRQR